MDTAHRNPPPISEVTDAGESTERVYQPRSDGSTTRTPPPRPAIERLEVFDPARSPAVNEWCSPDRLSTSAVPASVQRGLAPEDAYVGGVLATMTTHRRPVALARGAVLQYPGESACYRVPVRSPRIRLERCPGADRDDVLRGLNEQLAEQGAEVSPQALLGSMRPLQLGVLRCVWARGFLVEARLSRWAPGGLPLAPVVWHLLAAGPAVALEVLRLSPRDAEDARAALGWVAAFGPPRLRRVVVRGDLTRSSPLPPGVELIVEPPPPLVANGSACPYVEPGTQGLWAKWRQIDGLRLNGRRPEDAGAWTEPFRAQLWEGDQLERPGTESEPASASQRWTIARSDLP